MQIAITPRANITSHTYLSGLLIDDHNQYPLLIGRAGGQTLVGGTLTTQGLSLRPNAADLTTGAISTLGTLEASSTTVGSVTVAGGLAVAKRVYALDMTVTNAITGSVTGNAGTVTNGVYTNAANSMSLINPLTTLAESWIGPSSTTGIYFKAGNAGLGTAAPGYKLDVQGADFAGSSISATRYSGSGSGLVIRQAAGTQAAPTAIQSTQTIGGVYAYGYNGSDWGLGGRYEFASSEIWDTSGYGTNFYLKLVPNRSTTSATVLTVLNNGNVGIGSSIPLAPLHIKTNVTGAGSSLFRLDNSGTAGNQTGMEFYSPTSGDAGAFRAGRLYSVFDGTGYTDARLTFQTMAAGNVLVDTITLKADKVGLGTTVPTNIFSLGGNSARTIGMERHTTVNTAGNSLTVQAGGATVGATDKAGGDRYVKPGVSTGSAESGVQLQGCVAGAPGTADNSFATMLRVLGNKIGAYGVTPVIRPTALSAQLTTLTHTAPGTPDYAIADFTQTTPWGFSTQDEARTVMSVVANLQTRLAEAETKLKALGWLT